MDKILVKINNILNHAYNNYNANNDTINKMITIDTICKSQC
jgi:hypothetical protein